MTAFDRLLAELVYPAEGRTLDLTRADRGNWTGGQVGVGELRGSLRGISAAAYPSLDIASLSEAQIAAIYRHDYWDHVAGDALPPAIAIFVCDQAINQGVGAAVRDLQAALGVGQDGVLGPVTVAAAQRQANGADALLAELIARRALRYAATSTFIIFGLGWCRRLAAAARVSFRT